MLPKSRCQNLIENTIRTHGLSVLGWRDVNVKATNVGTEARMVMPNIKQVFISSESNGAEGKDLERTLYLVRKVIEHSISSLGLAETETDYFYICSLSSETLVYKGLLMD